MGKGYCQKVLVPVIYLAEVKGERRKTHIEQLLQVEGSKRAEGPEFEIGEHVITGEENSATSIDLERM